MKGLLIFIILGTYSSSLLAQGGGKAVFYQSVGPAQGDGPVTIMGSTMGAFEKGSSTLVQGAPYSATITNDMIQTLADGNRIVHTSTGTTARDSQGRTRQDTPLPAIGNLSAANAPHLVFLRDPVAQTSYTLNLTDKTAQKMPMPPTGAGSSTSTGGANRFFVRTGPGPATAAGPLPPGPLPSEIGLQTFVTINEQAQESTEDLGSQTIEGVPATGVRTTRTIPAGQIGNEKPISIVTEVWTSPDLKTVVYSKRTDPRMGEQTFRLTNIVRAEPDPSLFTVPADFKIVDGPQPIIYRQSH